MKNFFLFALCAIIFLIACNKPSDFGKELISDSNIPFEVLDTFSLNVVSERSDSLRTYVPGAVSLTMSNSIIGYLDDPDFGSIKAEAYAGFAVERILKDSLKYMQIDSATWEVYYDRDTTNQYGDITKPITLEVFRVTEQMKTTDTLFSNKSFASDNTPVAGLYNFVPKPLPSDSSFLKFRMNEQFINFIKQLPDTSFKNSIAVVNNFNGLMIKSPGKTEALLRVNFIDARNNLKIYYTSYTGKKDSIKLITTTNSIRHTHYVHDYTGSRFQKSIDQPESDSVVFIQAMAGPQLKLSLPDLAYLKNDGLNFAELELIVSDENTANFPKPKQLWLYKKGSDGQLTSIVDGTIAISSGYSSSFGGSLEEFTIDQKTVFKYRFRLPKHLTDYIDGKEGKELYISALGAASEPGKVIINGPQSSVRPMKIKLIITKVN